MMRTLVYVLAAIIAAIPVIGAAASIVVVTSPSTRSLQVVSADLSSGDLVGAKVNLPLSLGSTILSTAVAGDFAFTIAVDGSNTNTAKASLAVTFISDSAPQMVANTTFPSFVNTYFDGCYVAPGDLAARNTGDQYDLYIYLECKSSNGSRKAGNYVTYFTYSRSRNILAGPSQEGSYSLNTFDPKYKFVSALNAISVFGSGTTSGNGTYDRGTVYAVLTTTSFKNGQIYKPALHVLADSKAVPLGILAKAPTGFGRPRFAIASPTSFFSLYRKLCNTTAGETECSQPGFNGLEAVTLTKKYYSSSVAIGNQTESWSLGPADLAVSSVDQTLYRLGLAINSIPSAYLPTLSARAVSAAPAVGFKSEVKLPFGTEGPALPEVTLEIDAL